MSMPNLFLHCWLRVAQRFDRARDERGQTTAEYALVLIGVAALASLLLAWATKSDAISHLFDAVIDKITPG
jgi:Flp pilus assembly pilin Flp